MRRALQRAVAARRAFPVGEHVNQRKVKLMDTLRRRRPSKGHDGYCSWLGWLTMTPLPSMRHYRLQVSRLSVQQP